MVYNALHDLIWKRKADFNNEIWFFGAYCKILHFIMNVGQ